MKRENLSENSSKTKQFGRKLAKNFLSLPLQKKAVVIGLAGELGSGKTTFLQGFAAGLGIKEKILSPTFIIFRRFEIKGPRFKNFYHFDCYRIRDSKEIVGLGFQRIISEPRNIVAIEWPERIKKFLPEDYSGINFDVTDKNKRKIVFYGGKTLDNN